MQPTSLRILLALAIIYDALGFILFLIGLSPLMVISIPISFMVDIMALLTVVVCISYYLINLQTFLSSKEAEYEDQARRKPGPIAKKVNDIKDRLVNHISDMIWKSQLARSVYNIIASIIEAIPYIGDLSPTWTILAWFLLRLHGTLNEFLDKTNNDMKEAMSISINSPDSTRQLERPKPALAGIRSKSK